MRRFELVEGSSSKFWEIEQPDNLTLDIRWGRIGTAGKSQTKAFASVEKAAAAMEKLIEEKTRKGYAEAGGAAGASIGLACVTPKVAVSAAETTVVVTLPPWLAQGEPLRLQEARELAFASRRHPKPLTLADVSENWRCVRDHILGRLRFIDWSLLPGRGASEAEVRSVVQRAIEGKYCAEEGQSGDALRPALVRLRNRLLLELPDPDTEADALLLALVLNTFCSSNKVCGALIDYMVLSYGLEGALDVFLAGQRIQIREEDAVVTCSTFVDRPLSVGWRGPFSCGEERLRNHLAVAPENEWHACVELLEAALPGLHPSRQPAAALLLPERLALSNALALKLTASQVWPDYLRWLLLTVTEPAAIDALLGGRASYGSSFLQNEHALATLLIERGVDAESPRLSWRLVGLS